MGIPPFLVPPGRNPLAPLSPEPHPSTADTKISNFLPLAAAEPPGSMGCALTLLSLLTAPAPLAAPCTELFHTAEIQPCCSSCGSLPAPGPRKAARGSDDDAEMFPRSCGIASVPILLLFRSFVTCPLLVFLQPPLLGCAGGSPAEKMEFCHSFMILGEGIYCSLIISLPYSDILGCFPEVSLAQLGYFSRKNQNSLSNHI